MNDVIKNFYKDKNILVTGGAGYIGSALSKKLVELDANVIIVDDLSSGEISNILSIINRVKFYKKSILEFNELIKISKNIDIMFHLAALTNVNESNQDSNRYIDVNFCGTKNILECCRVNNIKKIVYASSCAVYGQIDQECSEDMICNPISIYGLSKYISELLIIKYSQLFDINSSILRYFNVLYSKGSVSYNFKKSIEENLDIIIYGDGLQSRDFVLLDDIIIANIISGVDRKLKYQILNVASGKSKSIIELLEDMKLQFSKDNKINNIFYKPARSNEVRYIKSNIEKYNKLKSEYNII